MAKVKEFFSNIKDNWNENKTSKLVKILSFVCGLLFGIVGIILVAIWKYIFSNNEEVNKHCIKLSIIGAIAKLIIMTKLCAVHMFGFGFPFNDLEKQNFYHPKHHYTKQIDKDDFFDINFREMERDMEQAFRQQERIFNSFFRNFERQFNNGVKPKDIKRTEKVSVDKDGYQTTKIEEKSPNSYKKVVIKEKYFNDKESDKKLDSEKKNKTGVGVKKEQKKAKKNKTNK